MSKPTVEQTRMGTEAIAFCIARTLIERDPSLKAPMRANMRKMWELPEERDDHDAADMVDTLIKALNDAAFFNQDFSSKRAFLKSAFVERAGPRRREPNHGLT